MVKPFHFWKGKERKFIDIQSRLYNYDNKLGTLYDINFTVVTSVMEKKKDSWVVG